MLSLKFPLVPRRWFPQRSIAKTPSNFWQFRTTISIALSLIFLGWALSAYQTPLWGWIGTIFCLLHLAKTGRGAIPVALAWTTGIVWIAAFDYSTPVGFMWRNASYWAASLIFLWIFATSIILSVAKIPRTFKIKGRTRKSVWMMSSILMTSCLGLGSCIYQFGLALK